MYFRNRNEEKLLPTFDPNRKYKGSELERLAEEILREDAKSEVCRSCDEAGEFQRGEQVGQQQVEQAPVDGEGNQLAIAFPEYTCANGHHWYAGEGKTRSIGGENPILFEEHIYQRKKREIHAAAGTVDPEIVSGSYNKAHPKGRKVNDSAARARGSSFYK